MRMDRRRLHDRLERMGEAPLPPPSPDFLVRTEERLRSLRSVTLVEDEVGSARTRRRGPWLAAAAAVVTVVTLVVVVPEGDPDTVSVATRGATSTSPPSSPVATTTTTTATTAAPDATPTSVPATVPAPPTAGASTTTSVPVRLRPTTTTAAPVAAAPTTVVTEPAPPVTTNSTTVTAPVAKLDLRCEAGTDERSAFVTCTWSATTDPAFGGWRLHRAGGPDVKRTVWSSADVSVRSYVDRDVAAGTTYQYAVEAVTGTGRTIAKGGIVSVACCGG